VANGDLVEAAREPQGSSAQRQRSGETSLIVWQQGGNPLVYDLTVRMSPLKLEALREQIAREYPDSDSNSPSNNDTASCAARKDVDQDVNV